MAHLVGYGAFGQTCPGQEVWDDTIGACMCPQGMETTGIVGQCVPAGTAPGWGEQCPAYTPLPAGTNCMCGPGLAYDPGKRMCTREAYGVKGGGAGPGSARPPTAKAGIGPLGWLAIAAAAGGVAYLIGRQSDKW